MLIVRGKAADIFLLLLWGLLISAYIQVLFLNGNMESITGAQAVYYEHSVPNLIIWGIISCLPLCVWLILRIKKIKFKYEKITVFSAIIIAGMQITGLLSTAISTDLPKGYDEDLPLYISYEAMLSLSSEKNILVFILDRLDVLYMRDTLEAYPHLYEYLDGFTHYENNIAQYFDTLPSVVSMLTQHYYTQGQTIEEYWEEAWGKHSYIDEMRENGYSTNLYIDYFSTIGNKSQIKNRTDNLREIVEMRVNLRDFYVTNMRLSLGRLAPYRLKNFFLRHIDPAFGNDLFEVVIDNPLTAQPPVVGDESDKMFYEFISENELSADNIKKVYTVMHMNGPHGDYGYTVAEGTEFNMRILNIYFEQMKELDIYDKSTIIILGDHGSAIHAPVSTSLLIKPEHSRGKLLVDHETELSNRYFSASISELAGIHQNDSEVTYFDIIGGLAPPVLIFYDLSNWWAAWDEYGTSGSMYLRGIYEVSGDASDYSNWHYIPN